MLQVLESVLIGFLVMAVMVACCLTATLLLLVIISWVVDGASRVSVASGRNRLPSG
ncbi:MAG: hypothetical protein ABSA52_17095 [Candidatus Binatia bacterium]|jgi:hypothetical protein